jgi:hypothetical protein
MSPWRKAMAEHRTIPDTPKHSIREPLTEKDKRNSPQQPNFKRSPASRMEPIVGASTWALGNQKCTRNKGNLTRNPNTKRTEQKPETAGNTTKPPKCNEDKTPKRGRIETNLKPTNERKERDRSG